MATEDSYIQSWHGIGSRSNTRMLNVFSINGTGLIQTSLTVPAGSWLNAVVIATPVAISGTSPVCDVRVGLTNGGQEIMADTAAQSQGIIQGAIASTYDVVQGLANTNTIYLQANTSGSGTIAGTINVLISYDPPSH